MLNYIKTFETFSEVQLDEGENFFEMVGSNLTNLIDDQKKAINQNFRKQTNFKALNILDRKNIKLTDEEIIKLISKDYTDRKKRLLSKRINRTDEVNKEFESFFYFIQYLVITLQINIQSILDNDPSILDTKRNSESFKVFDLGEVDNMDDNIDKLWSKLLITIGAIGKNVKNINLIKKGAIKYLDDQHLRWNSFFKNENWRKYQILQLPKAKVDEQQQENEGIINSKQALSSIKTTSIQPATKLPIAAAVVLTTAITPQFKSKFNQKSGSNVGANNMQTFFLDMIAKAENIYGKPFRINSGYRSKQYQEELRKNPRIKAARNSPHVQGVAADISLRGENTNKIIDALRKVGFNRFGVGKSFLHVDAGDRVNPRIWVPFARWGYKY